MNSENQLLAIRMVIVPLPAAFRVRSTVEQFPTLEVYETSLRILGAKLLFEELETLELTEDGGIKFTAKGRTYHYAAISRTSKEMPDEDVTGCLFKVLVALKQGGVEAAQESLAELQQMRKANTKTMLVTAVIVIIVCAVLVHLEESGCRRKSHNKTSEPNVPPIQEVQ